MNQAVIGQQADLVIRAKLNKEGNCFSPYHLLDILI